MARVDQESARKQNNMKHWRNEAAQIVFACIFLSMHILNLQ